MPVCYFDAADLSKESTLVHAAELVEQDASVFPLEYELGTASEGLALAGQRGDDYTRQSFVHVVWRYH